MNDQFVKNVLDHGFVRLVSYMQPADSVTRGYHHGSGQTWTGDLEICRATRNKPDAAWRSPDPNDEKAPHDAKLIAHMQDNDHTSPFEFMDFTFFVQAPLFVLRQWHRHRTWSYSEFSARYGVMRDLFYVPTPEAVGQQSKSNHQARVMEGGDLAVAQLFTESVRENSNAMHEGYQYALEASVPRELARLLLPMNVYTTMYAKVDLHNLLHFLRLRLDSHAQHEIRVYAQAILDLITPIVPVTIDKWRRSTLFVDPTDAPAQP